MLGSHDSYTYLSSTNKLYNSVTGPWKAQTKSIQEQYAAGVRYFDVRIKREVKANRNMWRVCHGLVDLNYVFTSIKSICAYFESLEGSYYRILLEKGNSGDKEAFRNEVKELKDKYPHFDWCVIKEDWETIFSKGTFETIDKTCKMNTIGEIFDMLGYSVSILKWALKNNPTITTEMIKDNKKLYFIDAV